MNVIEWAEAHPVVMTGVVWPALTATLTGLFKPRTPEAYSEMKPRLAAFLKFVGAVGFDVPNTVEALKQLVHGHAKPALIYRAERAPIPAPEMADFHDDEETKVL